VKSNEKIEQYVGVKEKLLIYLQKNPIKGQWYDFITIHYLQ